MYGVDKKPEVTVEIGEGVAVLRRKGVTRPVVATILKADQDAEGSVTRMVLDRIVHRPHETEFSGWRVGGAYASVLEKMQPES